MASCPCCSHTMLRHIRHNQIFWYCRHCWQEMPNLNASPSLAKYSQSLENLIQRKSLVNEFIKTEKLCQKVS
jgi:ribosomal protein L37AE/L43A